MAVLEKHPSVSPSESLERLQFGLGRTGYKEYAESPWAIVVQASFPEWMWAGVYYSWFSLKGHLQSYYELQDFYFFASRTEDQILGMWGLGFDVRSALEQYVESGYTVAQMLKSMGVPEDDIHVSFHRDFS